MKSIFQRSLSLAPTAGFSSWKEMEPSFLQPICVRSYQSD
jgi:hypothetical protein